MVSQGNIVVTDRLGSVRWSNAAGGSSYYPYGEERSIVTADDREKFGTYMRDNPGQDYAEQRYYGTGRGGSGARIRRDSDGGRGSYGKLESIRVRARGSGNFIDPGGLFRCNPDFCKPVSTVPAPPSQYNGNNGSQGPTFNWGPYPGDTEGPDPSPADTVLNGKSQNLLKSRLANFGSTHCNQVFSSVIQGYSTSDFVAEKPVAKTSISTTQRWPRTLPIRRIRLPATVSARHLATLWHTGKPLRPSSGMTLPQSFWGPTSFRIRIRSTRATSFCTSFYMHTRTAGATTRYSSISKTSV